ncbi:MAG: hypothetical protein LQ342_003678 [Letrouitia transgressa]|nr:MAG: hypothetical protein LQ342_003678 [Letrouitia transgressa]
MAFSENIFPSAARLVLALGFCIASYFTAVIVYRLIFHPLAKYPGPPLAKVTSLYAVYHAYIGDLQLDMWRCHQLYGEFVRYGPNKVIINTNTAIPEIYSRNANVQKSTAYRAFETSPTAHDLQSTVNKKAHARKRRVISQAFSESAIKSLETHIIQHVDSFVKHLAPAVTAVKTTEEGSWSPKRDMSKLCSWVSFDLMAELVFGKAFHMLDFADNRFIIDLIQIAAFRVGVCLQMPQLAVLNLDKIFTPHVRKLRDGYVRVSKDMAIERMKMDSRRQDLFSHILAAKDPETGKGFSMDEIWGESTLLIIAGSDAISIAMASCFYYMGRHLEVYSKISAEVRQAFSSVDEIRSGPKLSSCTYLRACIDESLRMSPPVGGALWREVCEGGISVDGQVIPQGYDVGVGIYAIQHNPAYYPDPFTYKPERWIPGGKFSQESIDLARSAFSAFSVGPVGCIGKNLAYLELMVVLARIAWGLEIRYTSDVDSKVPNEKYLAGYSEHAKHEYRLRDRFTSWKADLQLSFRDCRSSR